jgi:hypothetical protein
MLGSGEGVGFVLALIVASPLLLCVVGLCVVGLVPHVTLGTGVLAVSANAFVNFAGHSQAGNARRGVMAVFTLPVRSACLRPCVWPRTRTC